MSQASSLDGPAVTASSEGFRFAGETKATLDFDMKDGKPTVTKIHLDCVAKVPNASAAAFNKAAQDANAGCPISRLLNAEIILSARLA